MPFLPTPVQGQVLSEKLSNWRPAVLASFPAPRLSSKSAEAQPKTAAFRVLVTDDNAVNQKLACALLARLGCEVDTAVDGLDALQKAS